MIFSWKQRCVFLLENGWMQVIHMTMWKGYILFPEGTLPGTNIAPKNGWLEYYFPIGEAYFQGLR